jgi:tetratricopeptide (TPR) repeat protein
MPAADPQAAQATLSEANPPSPGVIDPAATVIDPGVPAAPIKKAAGAKLSVTRGPKAGTEFSIGPGETSIGRQGDSTIVIPDISVSRKHVVVRREGSKCILVDQGSGNGTLLNGARVQAETELQDGDVIVMGDTEMTFLAPRAAPAAARPAPRAAGAPQRRSASQPKAIQRREVEVEPEPESNTSEIPFDLHAKQKARRKRLLLLGGLGVMLLVLVGAIKIRNDRLAVSAAAATEQEALRKIIEQVQEHSEAGKKAASARDFKVAADEFQKGIQVAEASPHEDHDLQRRLDELKRRNDASRREIDNQEKLEAAKAALDKGQFAAAVEKLKAVSQDSALADKVSDMTDEMKKKLPDKISEAKAALKNKDFPAATQAVTDVLAVDPTSTEAAAMSKAIEVAGHEPPKGPRVGGSRLPPEDPTSKAVEAFTGGRLDEAITLASACEDARCKNLRDKLTVFRDAFNNLDSEGNVEKAVQVLKSIPGGASSPYMQKIGAKGSDTFVKEGLKAMSADNYPKAFAAFRQVLAADPGNEVAKKNMSQIRTRARELNEQAYVDMSGIDQDKARKELEMVLQITDPADEIHQKAKNRLKKLQGGGGE